MRVRARPLVLVALLLIAFALPARARSAFDFYVLALSWSPSYCETAGSRADPRQCGSRPYAFVVHGLWPQFERGYPEFCVRPAPFVPEPLVRSMLELMPSRQLVIHQWRKHGTCSGLAPEEYFALVRRAREKVRIPAGFQRLSEYRMVTPAEVETAFIAANAGLERDMIAVDCDRRYLREVRVCVNKELEFRACPDVDRRACRAPSMVMPPMRGIPSRL
jgi:ribonuclease T2